MPEQDEPNEGTRPSRRSGRAREAILRAAIELASEQGDAELSIEGIASRAGVGKATIYRWWPNKTSVLLDAFLSTLSADWPFPNSGSARDDLGEQMVAAVNLLSGPQVGKALTALLAAGQRDPAIASALRNRFIADRRASGRDVVRRGVERGELRADTDPDLLLDMLYGAVYYRLLVSGENPDVAYVKALLDQAWPLWSPAGQPPDRATVSEAEAPTAADVSSAERGRDGGRE